MWRRSDGDGGGGGVPTPALRPPPPPPHTRTQNIKLAATVIGPGGDLFWLEGRPAEKGRQVLVRRARGGGAPADVTPPPDSGINVRTSVQEYGGGDFVLGESEAYFSNFA